MAEQTSAANGIVPTILDPATCAKKGLCTVAQGRAVETHQLYFELHGALDGAQKLLFVMVKHFSRKPDHSVLVFDNRGVGNSDAGPLGIYKTSEMAKDTVDLMEYLGWTADRSVHLFGVSMGGMISQELCLLVPKRFKSVSFISTKAGNKFDLPPLSGLYKLTRLLSRTVTEEQSIEMLMTMLFPAEFLAQPTEGGGTKREEIYESLLQRIRRTRKQPAAGVAGQLSAALSHSCPAASLDQLIEPARSIELHKDLPGSEYLLIPGAGHAICSQLPEQSNAILERVIDEGNRAFS
ncbi:hypothetical protein PtA15_1A658 [Puccinia triticina]|uniref:AB hydrolase-1 domain-containing protein n=1 Tax=Puccinia triticina TaxID=208348 RepID=A0ABY7C8T7_9BASI|nr:uncharacterized protein PtA15_1A658 [Puccinia triticina]WAQ81318.1 hypothetical protein PtA15_1A658 [Puccinia triticina]